MKLSKSQLAVLALIIVNMIWGAAPPIFKWALEDIHPYTLAFLRFFLPALLMYPFVRGRLKVHRKDYLNIIYIGIFGITVNILFFFQGLLQAPSINASLIASSGPIFIILFSIFFLREKLKSKLVLGSIIGLFGVLLVLIVPFIKNGNLVALGNLFFLIAMFGSIISILITRKIMKRNDPIAITFWAFFIGGLGFLPFFINEVNTYGFLQNLTSQGIVGLIFGIFLSSLAAYYLQTWALKYLTAADVSVFTYIDPVVTILIAIPLLGEFPDAAFVAGTVLVLGGILIAEGRLHYHPFHLFLKK
ncbi:MAG: DMT family transporter [Candidatus Levybacteria bacterium]|nr:DMT family transporter [Candidatus Levybacteria bacterium]